MVSDEKIISALLANKSIRDVSIKLGIAESVIYGRLRNPSFKKMFDDARTELLEGTKDRLQLEMSGSVAVLAEVRDNTSASPQIRINAADAILRHAYRMTEMLDIITRIEALEKQMKED